MHNDKNRLRTGRIALPLAAALVASLSIMASPAEAAPDRGDCGWAWDDRDGWFDSPALYYNNCSYYAVQIRVIRDNSADSTRCVAAKDYEYMDNMKSTRFKVLDTSYPLGGVGCPFGF